MQRSSDEYADLISIPCGNNLGKKLYYLILHVSHDLKEDIISVCFRIIWMISGESRKKRHYEKLNYLRYNVAFNKNSFCCLPFLATMLTFALVFFSFSLFRFIQNRVCSGYVLSLLLHVLDNRELFFFNVD